MLSVRHEGHRVARPHPPLGRFTSTNGGVGLSLPLPDEVAGVHRRVPCSVWTVVHLIQLRRVDLQRRLRRHLARVVVSERGRLYLCSLAALRSVFIDDEFLLISKFVIRQFLLSFCYPVSVDDGRWRNCVQNLAREVLALLQVGSSLRLTRLITIGRDGKSLGGHHAIGYAHEHSLRLLLASGAFPGSVDRPAQLVEAHARRFTRTRHLLFCLRQCRYNVHDGRGRSNGLLIVGVSYIRSHIMQLSLHLHEATASEL